MPDKTILQQEKNLKDKILENLIILTTIHGLGQMEIARQLGYSNDVFSRLKSDRNYSPSPQLLAAISLLKELTELKKSGVRVNVDFMEEIRVMRRRLDELEKQLRVPYPEHKPDPMLLNEPKGVSSCDEADSVNRKLAQDAAREYPPENPPKSK